MTRTQTIFGGIALLLLGGCVAGSGDSQHAATAGALSQILLGVWHGVIAPITLIGEVINVFAPHALPWSVRLYESKGAGVRYDVGFYLGRVGSPLFASSRWRPRRSI